MKSTSLHQLRLEASKSLTLAFREVFKHFVTPFELKIPQKKLLSKQASIIETFEIDLNLIDKTDLNFLLAEFKIISKNFLTASNPFEEKNNNLRNYFFALPADLRSDYHRNLRIVNHIIDNFKDSLETSSTIVSTHSNILKFNRHPSEFIELIAALFQGNCFIRTDGSVLRRAHIIKVFKEVFNFEYDDKLLLKLLDAKVKNKRDKAPFLSELTKAFDLYCEQREQGE